jgi:hypothetical protein
MNTTDKKDERTLGAVIGRMRKSKSTMCNFTKKRLRKFMKAYIKRANE